MMSQPKADKFLRETWIRRAGEVEVRRLGGAPLVYPFVARTRPDLSARTALTAAATFRVPEWAEPAVGVPLLAIGLIAMLAASTVTVISIYLRYDTTWYVLSDRSLREAIADGRIVIDPFDGAAPTWVRTFFCGPESFTPDLAPAVGQAPGIRHYFVAAGLNSVGTWTAASDTAGTIARYEIRWLVDATQASPLTLSAATRQTTVRPSRT